MRTAVLLTGMYLATVAAAATPMGTAPAGSSAATLTDAAVELPPITVSPSDEPTYIERLSARIIAEIGITAELPKLYRDTARS